MTDQTLLIGIIVLVLLVLVFSRRETKSSSTHTHQIDLDDLDISENPPERRGRRHNGRMPGLLLAPYRLYGPAFLTLGLVTLLVASLLAR